MTPPVRHLGCILADDMGLGKTLQGISLLWTLLHSGHDQLGGQPLARRVIIVCPTSLVSNWDSECTKWLKVGGAERRATISIIMIICKFSAAELCFVLCDPG